MTPAEHRAVSSELAGALTVAARREANPHRRNELVEAAKDTARWAGKPLGRVPRTAVTTTTRTLTDLTRNPNGATAALAAAQVTRTLIALAAAHRASRAAQVAHEQRQTRLQQAAARREALAQAQATVRPGNHYRTDHGVIRIERSAKGHLYALAQDDAGLWQKAAPERIIDAAAGQRMTRQQVQDHRRARTLGRSSGPGPATVPAIPSR